MNNYKGCVYLIKGGDFYKVGMTVSNAEQRMQALQTASPLKLELIKTFKSYNPSKDEKAIHFLLKEYRVTGEWFQLPNHLIANFDWFKPAVLSTVEKEQNSQQKSTTVFCDQSRQAYFERYKLDYESLVKDLSSRQLFAFAFVRQNVDTVIIRAIEHLDDYTLLFIYCLMIDRSFEIPHHSAFDPEFIVQITRFGESISMLAALSNAATIYYRKEKNLSL